MSSFSLSGGVQVFGFISPSDTTDQYPVIDPLYGIDGFRNVDTLSDLNSIPTLRRRAGMVVGVSGGTTYYKLNLPPWNNTITDWSIFNTGSSGGTISGDYLPLSGGTVSGGTDFTNGLTANTISASTYLNLPQDIFVTGGTYSGDTIIFINNTGGTFNVSGITSSTNFTGGTVTGSTEFTNGLTANTISASTYQNLPIDVFVTGGTYSLGTATFTNNTGGTFNVSGFFTGSTDNYITGGTFDKNTETLTLTDITGGTITITGFTDTFVTGGTYSAGTTTFTNNSGGTFNVSGFYTGETSYVNSLTTGIGLSGDSTTGSITIINTDPDQVVTISGGTGIITGGTYPNLTITNSLPDQTVVLNNGSNIDVSGTYPNFTINVTGLTDNDIYVTGFTYSSNTFTIYQNSGSSLTSTINDVTGLTINGNLNVTGTTSSETISATTYQNLPTDIRVTGATYSNNTFTYTNNTGGTFNVNFNTITGLTINGNLSVTGTTNIGTISATTYQNLPTDIRVTGGTYTAGTATFTNNTGGTFNVTGFTTGGTSSGYWQYRKTYNAFHSTAGLSGSGNQGAILSNTLFAFPIDVKRDVTISSLVIGNVGASAGNSVWGVYDSLNGEPNNLIFQTTAFNNAVTGAVSYTISPTQSLTTGIYWVVYHSSSTPTLRVMQVANSVPNIIGENGSLFNGSMTYLFRSLVYSGTLPSPFGAASLPTTISLIPFVQFGVTY